VLCLFRSGAPVWVVAAHVREREENLPDHMDGFSKSLCHLSSDLAWVLLAPGMAAFWAPPIHPQRRTMHVGWTGRCMENGRRPDHHRNETAAAGQMHQAVLLVIFAIDSMCAISFSIDFLSSSFRSRNCCVVLFLVLPKASVDCLLPWQPHQWRRTILLMELPPLWPKRGRPKS